jgi:hypothetical protein
MLSIRYERKKLATDNIAIINKTIITARFNKFASDCAKPLSIKNLIARPIASIDKAEKLKAINTKNKFNLYGFKNFDKYNKP